ncbi:MAG: nuclear transport factor 2 family protein [Tepidisphaera sp.]|nr:nuclear transport factor 2 family protein [Tepidisphaera sp.]
MNQSTLALESLDIGRQLVDFCWQGKADEAIDALYAPDVVSIEAKDCADCGPARREGIAAKRAKAAWWNDNHIIHKTEVSGPWPHADRFIVRFNYELTPKLGPMAGKRMRLEEAGLYTVRDGKIVQEEFFYHMGE